MVLDARFLILLAATCLALVGLLALATRLHYYFHLVPFIAGFAVIAALLLRLFGLQAFQWWYVGLSAIALFAGLLWHLGSPGGQRALAELRRQVLEAVPQGEIRQQVAKELAPTRAIVQDASVDVVVFALVFLAASWVFGRML